MSSICFHRAAGTSDTLNMCVIECVCVRVCACVCVCVCVCNLDAVLLQLQKPRHDNAFCIPKPPQARCSLRAVSWIRCVYTHRRTDAQAHTRTLYIYMCVYIYIYREREREREKSPGAPQETLSIFIHTKQLRRSARIV